MGICQNVLLSFLSLIRRNEVDDSQQEGDNRKHIASGNHRQSYPDDLSGKQKLAVPDIRRQELLSEEKSDCQTCHHCQHGVMSQEKQSG